jgi:hypothetical protein
MMRTLKGSLLAAALCSFIVLGAASDAIAAGDNEGGAAAAESLFQEARKLADAKRYSEACPKFVASQKLAPAIGTLLNLADCYEKNNQLASAWARFHEAIALAQRLGRTNREQTARERADRLEPRLIKLSILARASGLEVKLDGNPIEPSALATPIPVDAGKHTIEATSKGKKPFSTTIEVSDKAKSPTVEIPVLEDEGKVAAAGGPTKEPPKDGTPPKETPFTPPPQERQSTWSGRKTLAVIVASAGVLGLGVGGFYAYRARGRWVDAQEYCNSEYQCTQDGVDLTADAQRFGNFGTIGFIAGGVLIAGGAVLYFTAPKPKKLAGPSVQQLGFGPGSVVVGGTF